jgi:hypothetical protein
MPSLLPERPEGGLAMTLSIGRPFPDTSARAREAHDRRAAALSLAAGHGCALTWPNGEETAYGATFALSYDKGLPHDADGFVQGPSHAAMVRALTGHEDGAVETLPLGSNRRPGSSPEAPPRHTTAPGENPAQPLGYRMLTSPLTGHVYEVQGAHHRAGAPTRQRRAGRRDGRSLRDGALPRCALHRSGGAGPDHRGRT